MTSRRLSTLRRQALALEPRFLLDAAVVATVAQAVDATATKPGVAAEGSQATISIDAQSAAQSVDLFKDVNVSLDAGSQELDTLVVTVDRTGANQALLIDGSEIALQATVLAQTTNDHGYSYEVSVTGNTTRISISIASSNAYQASDVAALIDSMAYQTRDTTVESGKVHVALATLSDEGGDVADLNIHADIDVTSTINVAPVLSDAGIPELAQSITLGSLGASKDVAYSNDGKYLYAANASGTIAVFAVGEHDVLKNTQVLSGVPNLGSVSDLAVAADGKSLYAISGGNIITLDIGADGALSNARATSGGATLINMTLSDDGAQLYVSTQYNGLAVFNRDAATGDLTRIQTLDEGSVGGGRTRTVVSAGDYVFVASGTNLVTLQRNDNGTLSKLDFGYLDTGISTSTIPSLAATADGGMVFVGAGSTIRIYALRDGNLEARGTVTLANVSALAVSSDGGKLYATSSSGTMNIYALSASGTLTLSQTVADVGGAAAIALSKDGTNVVVAGNTLSRFSTTPTYIVGAEITLTGDLSLTDANLDALAGGAGDYHGASVTVARQGGGSADDQFGFAATGAYALAGNQITRDGQAIASFVQNGGVLTLTFTAAISKAEANAVLQHITYRNVGSPVSGNVVTLTVTASDGELSSTSRNIDLLMANNTPPELVATVVNNPVYDTASQAVTLFKDASVNTGETGQAIIALSVTVDGVAAAANEFLIVDGTRVDLSQASSGSTASGYGYTYTISNGVGTLTVNHAAGIGLAATQALVNGIAYVNDTTRATTGTRAFTLASVQDSGGSANGGSDISAPGISATVTLGINNAPQIVTEVSTPNAALYYANGTLSGYNEYVTDIVLSDDGKTLLVTGSSAANAGGVSTLRVYARDASTGALSLIQTFTQGEVDNPATTDIEVNGMTGITAMAMQGGTLYLAGYGAGASLAAYSLVMFTYDASTGQLSYDGVVATQGVGGVSGLDASISEIVLSADGKSLYTINGVNPIDGSTSKSELAQFSRDPATGALTFLGSYVGGSAALGMNVPSGIVVTADGTSVYVSNRSNSMLSVFSRNTDTGALTFVGAINDASISADPDSGVRPSDNRYLLTLQDIVVSPDDAFVYVGSGDMATVSIFSRNAADGSLTYVGTMDLYNSGLTPANALSVRELAVSSDGTALYVGLNGNSSLLVFNRDSATGLLTFADRVTLGSALTTQIVVSADGLNIYGGRPSANTGLAIVSARPNGVYVPGEASTPFAQNIGFSDADFDDQNNYQGATLTIARSGGASADDVFAFANGAGLTLENGKIVQAGVAIADFTAQSGTLTVTFIASVDKATANQVLKQVTYRNGGEPPPARVDLNVAVGDGGKSASTVLVLLPGEAPGETPVETPSVAPTDTTPGLDATPVPSDLTIADGATTFPPLDLFKDVNVQTETAGVDELSELVITVNSAGENQALIIDGKLITLETGGGSTRADNDGYFYTVTVSGSTTTITISLDSFAPGTAEVNALIAGLRYQVQQNTVASGAVVVTLQSLSDAGGQTADLSAIRATIQVDNQNNVPPVLAGDSLKETESFDSGSLAASTEVAYSADGKFAYVAGGDNTITVFAVDASSGKLVEAQRLSVPDLGTVNHLVVSADGKSVYTISGNGNLMQFSVGGTGQLSLAATLSVGIGSIGGMAISDDGAQVYVDASNNFGREVYVYSRDAATGALTQIQTLDAVRNATLATAGDYVYVLHVGATFFSNHELKVYERTANGQLELIDSIALAPTGFDPVDYAVATSKDGSLLYVGDPTANDIAIYRLGSDNKLTRVDTVASDAIGSLALSADGALLYAATTNGTVNVYAVSAAGSLTLTRSVAGSTDGGDIAVSADGKSVLVSGGGLSHLSSLLTATPGEAVVLADGLSLSDVNFDRLAQGAGDYGGGALTILRDGGASSSDVFGFAGANGYVLQDGQILKEGRAVASFSQQAGALSISFLAGATQADANAILRQVTYTNQGGQAGERVALAVRASDGIADSQVVRVEVLLAGADTPEPGTGEPEPQVDATGGSAAISIGTNGAAQAVDLFKDVSVTLGKDGGELDLMRITVDRIGANQALLIDGEAIQLVSTNDAIQVTAKGTIYMVDVAGSTTTIKVWLSGRTASDVAALIDNISYQTRDATVPDGVVTITLAGLADINNNEVEPNIRATVTVSHATDPGVPEVPDLTFPDVDLADVDSTKLTLDQVLAGTNARATALSPDDTQLYVLGNDDQGGGVLRVYQRDPATGALTLVDSLGVSDAALANGTSIVVSADGGLVFVAGDEGSNISIYRRDTATGALSKLGMLDGATNADIGGITELAVSSDGLSVYASTAAGKVLALARNPADNSLSFVGSYQPDWDNGRSITVSADGKTVFMTQSGGWRVFAFTRDAATSALSDMRETTNTVGNHAMDAAVSPDGQFLYTVNFNQSQSHIAIYRIGSDGALIEAGTMTVGVNLTDIAVSADGKAVYALSGAGGNVLIVYQRDTATGLLSETARISNEAFGSTSDGVANITVSADGRSVYVTDADSGAIVVLTAHGDAVEAPPIVIDLKDTNTAYTPGDAPIQLVEDSAITSDGGNLASYGGATLTLAREGGANAQDAFSFLADSWTYDSATGQIRQAGVLVASVVASEGQWVITFNADATWPQVGSVLHRIGYANTGAGNENVVLGITYTAADGATAKATTIIAIAAAQLPNTEPVDSGIPVTPGEPRVGEPYAYTLPAGLFTDADGDALVWSVAGLPAGLSFDAGTRTISGTALAAGSYALTVTATDPSGASVSRAVTLAVVAANTNPDPGTGPGTEPGTPTTPAPGEDPDPNVNPNPGTSVTPPPDLNTQLRPAVFPSDLQGTPEQRIQEQRLQEAVTRPTDAPAVGLGMGPGSTAFDVTPNDGLTPHGFGPRDGLALHDGLTPRDGLASQAPWTSAAMLDAQLADAMERRDADAVKRFTMDAPGRASSPLVVLASPDAAGLSFAVASLSGVWRADASGNRHVYALPAGLVRSSSPVTALTLRMADGSALPAGVRLDAARGLIVAPGLTGAQTLSLQLLVRTASGEVKAIPVTVSADRVGAWRQGGDVLAARDSADTSTDIATADKPALSDQLRQSAAQGVLAQARQFLASLDADAPAGGTVNTIAVDTPVNPIHVAS